MTKEEIIRGHVRRFYQQNAFSDCIENNFVPWWLHQEFKIPEAEAMACSSDGNFDFGLDGFYIHESDKKYELTLVQGKFTSDLIQIKKGVADITRFIPKLASIISEYESDSLKENILVKRLRGKVGRLDLANKQLEVHASVISLWSKDKEMLLEYTNSGRGELLKAFRRSFVDKDVSLDVSLCDVNDIIKSDTIPGDSVVAPKSTLIAVSGRAQIAMGGSSLVYGTSKLADMVKLYEDRGNHLFDRNVRYFIHKKKNTEHGPSAKIRASLDAINKGIMPPEKFLFLHNGITLFSENATGMSDAHISLVNPYILNGCQTIKSAYFFYQEMLQKGKLISERWSAIPVFTRITVSPDENLWREIAESSNRQNSLSASALRSNDEVQINLESLFKELGIFYQRQEGSFENYSRTDFDHIEEVFQNSIKEPITIESLAQVIVCVSNNVSLSYASRQSEIFESDNMYRKVFSTENLKNLPFLVLVHNIRKVIDLAIRDAIPENSQKYLSFRPTRYKNLFTRLIVKSLAERYDIPGLIDDFGDEVLVRRGSKPRDLKEFLTSRIRSKEYPLLSVVGDTYFDDKTLQWIKENSQELLDYTERKLGLRNPISIPDLVAEA